MTILTFKKKQGSIFACGNEEHRIGLEGWKGKKVEETVKKKALLYAADVLEALQRDILSQPRSPLFHAQEKNGVC